MVVVQDDRQDEMITSDGANPAKTYFMYRVFRCVRMKLSGTNGRIVVGGESDEMRIDNPITRRQESIRRRPRFERVKRVCVLVCSKKRR